MKAKLFFFFLLFFVIDARSQNVDPDRQWSMFRGYYASGSLDRAGLPSRWDIETGENIAWKTPVPGLGHSSPVIWGNHVYVTSALKQGGGDENLKTGLYGSIEPVDDSSVHEWNLYCLDKESGEVKWQRTAVTRVPRQKRHPMSSHANSTPATNGEYVVAFFGAEGLYCFDKNGKLMWEKDFGMLKSAFFLVESAEWEFASSPLIYENVVIIQCDVLHNSFLAAYDIKTGNELWKKERDELPGWCTPNIYFDGAETRIAVNGFKHRGGYDFKTGEEIWKMAGGGDIPVPTPITGKELVYFNSAHGKISPILAIQADAKGEIILDENGTPGEYLRWAKLRGGSYMCSLLLYGDYLYNLAWNGRLTCFNALTGEEIYTEKAGNGTSYTSSPVASDGIIYIADNDGGVFLVQAGPEFKLLEENTVGEPVLSTPAISEKYIFFRTKNHLVAVSEL